MPLREDLDTPWTFEPEPSHRRYESSYILIALAEQSPVVSGVFEKAPDDLFIGVAEFDTEDLVRSQSASQFLQRGTCTEDVPVVDDKASSWVVDTSNKFGALRNRRDHAERQRLERDLCPKGLRFLRQTSQRFDERFDILYGGGTVSADLDESSIECSRRFEQLLPMPTPSRVGFPPPSGAQFDLDMAQSCTADLFSQCVVADRVPNCSQIIEDESETCPSGGRDLSHPVEGIEGTAFTRPHRGGVPGTRPTGRNQFYPGHCSSRILLHSRNL